MSMRDGKRGAAGFPRWPMVVLAAALGSVLATPALAQFYVGPSYLRVPGAEGQRPNPRPYRDWVRAEANYWTKRPQLRRSRGTQEKYIPLKFTGAQAPQKGPDVLSLAIDKQSPALAALMNSCRNGDTLPLLTYAESAEMSRHTQEDGPRPADIPAFYEYALKNVRLTCPVVAGAPEQALQLHFEEIEWLNTRAEPQPREVTQPPARLAPVTESGGRKVFVVHWLASISDSSDDQCETLNLKPSEGDYYALMTPARAAEQRASLARKGGITARELPYRGPDEMNVTLLPGIVADPGFIAPRVDVARGFDLDGDDGSGTPPAHTRKHRNYVSPDGRRGIDNQTFAIQGCVSNLRRTGFRPQLSNEMRRAGGLAMLIEISGIDDERNDNDVAVTVLYSTDPMRRDGTSTIILPDYTFRVSTAPQFGKAFARFKGRLVDGVVTTGPVKQFLLRDSPNSSTTEIRDARLRMELKPDGTMNAVLGGYLDWREYVANAFSKGSDYENTIGFSIPGMYNAVRRAADGLKDPLTGEFNGISTAYEMEGVRAFIPPAQERALLAGKIEEPAKAAGRIQVSMSETERSAVAK